MQNNNPMFVTDCLAVNKIVNSQHRKPEQDFDEEALVRPMLLIRWARTLWRVARQVHYPTNPPLSEQKSVPAYLSHENETIPS